MSLTLYSAFWAKALITPEPSLQAHHKNIELQVDPQAMVCIYSMKLLVKNTIVSLLVVAFHSQSPNLAYEEQEPGYATKFHPYNNANTTLVKVACHVYEQPPQANSKHN